MSTLEEILATLEEEDVQVIKQTLAAKDKDAQIARRDLEVAKSADLKDRFPRAWKVYGKGKLQLGDALTNEEIVAKFQGMENDLAELGVPLGEPTPTAPQQQPVAMPDPAAAFGVPVGGGGAPTAARNLEAEFEEAMRSELPDDRVRIIELINDMGQQERERLVDRLNSKPSALQLRSRGF